MAHVGALHSKARLDYIVRPEECTAFAAVHKLGAAAQNSFFTSTVSYVRTKHCHGYYPNEWWYLEQDKKWNY